VPRDIYDSEDNHVLVRDILDGFSVIPARYEQVPIRRKDTWEIQKTNEAWLFPTVVQSTK
jgi:hypothetical protein